MSGTGERDSRIAIAKSRPPIITRDSESLITRGLAESRGNTPTDSTGPRAPTSAVNNDTSTHQQPDHANETSQSLRPRQSSAALRFESLSTYGGPNSLSNFAGSLRRAAGFYEITRRASQHDELTEAHDAETEAPSEPRASDIEVGPSRGSLLRNVFSNGQRKHSDHAIADDLDHLATSPAPADVNLRIAEHRRLSSARAPHFHHDSIFKRPSHAELSGMPVGSYGSTYGSLASRLNEPAQRQADRLFTEQQATGASMPDKEREPLLVKQVQTSDGTAVDVVVGQSTVPQTIFNSVNTLIGVGMLSLPLAVKYGGWLIGMFFFALSAWTTSYTAKLLAKCLDVDPSLVTFADIGYISFGSRARVLISILFSIELLGVCIALVILFADSVDLLITGWGTTVWKLVCGLAIIPLSFLPMRFLSFTSILGILCCILIVVAVFVDGIIKPHALGSLHEPAKTYLFPENWLTLPLAFGLLMAPWGGHSVFPNLYRDMRHPRKFGKALNVTYLFTYPLEAALAIAGYIMFGEGVRDEITSNIFLTKGYPKWLSVVIAVAIAIIPLTKIPLNQRPIVSTLEIFLGLDARAMASTTSLAGMSNVARGALRITVRVLVPVVITILAIAIPSFDRIMSLLGSVACFSICVVLPCAFHVKIFGRELSMSQWLFDWSLIVLCTILGIVGTVFALLPKEMIGAS